MKALFLTKQPSSATASSSTVQGASEAGLRTVWFNARLKPPPSSPPLPQAIISRFSELQPLISRWR